MHFFTTTFSLVLLAGPAFSQLAQILSPSAGSMLTAGNKVTVQIGTNIYIENIDEVALVIGIESCGPNGGSVCAPANELMGDILYQGPFNPQSGPYGGGSLYENFTLTVPASVPAGTASLNVLRLFLEGDGSAPVVEYLNETVTVVA